METADVLKHELHKTELRLLAELRGLRRGRRHGEGKVAHDLTLGQRIADKVAATMGSWNFIIIQSLLLAIWIVLNVTAFIQKWDPYPFILLNLALSFQAAYAAPFIMMAQNRQQDIDRKEAENDHQINIKAELEIELLHQKIDELREKEGLEPHRRHRRTHRHSCRKAPTPPPRPFVARASCPQLQHFKERAGWKPAATRRGVAPSPKATSATAPGARRTGA